MKKLTCFAMLLLASACATKPAPYTVTQTTSPSGTVKTNIKNEGSLESTQLLGCISLSQTSNQHTPADLYKATVECVNEDKYLEAAELFRLAGAYAHYDKMRVADISARQAGTVLIMNHIAPLPDEKKHKLQPYLASLPKQGSKDLASLCSNLKRLGAPAYYPTYMINHGMDAIMAAMKGTENKGLVDNFDSDATWKKILAPLHCPAS